MTKRISTLILAAVTLAPVVLGGKPPSSPSCTDIPITWTIDQGTNIGGEAAPYVDGESGVAALLSICSQKDATLVLRNSTRAIQFRWPAVVSSTNGVTPVWATEANSLWDKAFLNVRQILGNTATLPVSDYDITTTLVSTFLFTGDENYPAEKTTYLLRMSNTTDPLTGTDGHFADPQNVDTLINQPYHTSKVRVQYSALERKWTVTPDDTEAVNGDGGPTSVATLLMTKRNTTTNIGQFANMRFRFVIQVK